MKRFVFVLGVGLSGAGSVGACGSDAPVAPAPGPEGGSHHVDPFNGDCGTARWADFSDACWSCACQTCKTTLNACNDDCIGFMECAFQKHTLVNVLADIGCEIRATAGECLTSDSLKAGEGPATQFDTCLIGATKPAGHFRACEVECGVPYSGDVCQRYPPPPATHGG